MTITEIIPDDLPEWMIEAMADGQFFNRVLEKVKELELICTDEKVKAILDHNTGHKMQYNKKDYLGWSDCNDGGPIWNFNQYNYRRKPKKLKPEVVTEFSPIQERIISYVELTKEVRELLGDLVDE